MIQANQQLSDVSPGGTVKDPVMHTGDDPSGPTSTPGPGRSRVVLPWVVIACGATCWVIVIVLAVVSVVNWFTAYRW